MTKSTKTIFSNAGMTRREFAISLGAGITSVITGYVLVTNFFAPVPPSDDTIPVSYPQLANNITLGTLDGLTTLQLTGGANKPQLCAVNSEGWEILKRLDGKHSIPEIRQNLYPVEKHPLHEKMDAQIATFIAWVGIYGFLKEPFYTTIYETYQT